MPAGPRSDVVREGCIGVYHTWSRCVQRARLCGRDPLTGVDFSYRKDCIRQLLEWLASVFAVEVGNYCILENHEHLISRTRPDIANGWSDEEVAWRWKCAWPNWLGGRWQRRPTDSEIRQLLADSAKLAAARRNLASLSWFMARWKEPIAKLANSETNTRGHFWEQRFGARELVDEGAILTCSIYVDVNQVQAGAAPSLEASHHSAIQDRLRLWRKQQALASVAKFNSQQRPGDPLPVEQMEQLLAGCWLAPITDDGPLLLVPESLSPTPIVPPSEPASEPQPEPAATERADHDESAARQPPTGQQRPEQKKTDQRRADQHQTDQHQTDQRRAGQQRAERNQARQAPPGGRSPTGRGTGQPAATPSSSVAAVQPPADGPARTIHDRLQRRRRPRASDHTFLSLPTEQYLGLALWAAEQALARRRGPPPPDMAQQLRQLSIDPDCWYAAVEEFDAWFHRAVGAVRNLAPVLARTGHRWLHGIRHCRDLFT